MYKDWSIRAWKQWCQQKLPIDIIYILCTLLLFNSMQFAIKMTYLSVIFVRYLSSWVPKSIIGIISQIAHNIHSYENDSGHSQPHTITDYLSNRRLLWSRLLWELFFQIKFWFLSHDDIDVFEVGSNWGLLQWCSSFSFQSQLVMLAAQYQSKFILST